MTLVFSLKTHYTTILFTLLTVCVFSQAGNYTFTTSTGNALTNMAGSTNLIGANQDDAVSTVTNIGFTFNFACTNYTQFSVNSNGLLGLGGTAVTNQWNNAIAGSPSYPIIAAIWDDMHTCTNGRVHFRLTGTAPNRVLTVEWFFGNLAQNGGAANKTVQVRLYETTNIVEIVYGTVGTPNFESASVGLANSSASFHSAVTTANTSSNVVATDNNTTLPATGRMYRYTPVTSSTYTNSTLTQQLTGNVQRCATNQVITRLEVNASIGCAALNLTNFQLGAGASTNLVGDVSTIRIYYTGNTAAFSPVNEFVAGGTVPTGASNSITGTRALTNGINYFWIVYDLNPGATIGNLIDASCTQITVGGSNFVPTVTNPAGNGTIVACLAPGGVNSGLETWLRADMAYTPGTPATWINQSSTGTATILNGTSNPVLNTTSTSYNYNPFVDFTAPTGVIVDGDASPVRQFIRLSGNNFNVGPSFRSLFFAYNLTDVSRVNTHQATTADISTWAIPAVNGTLHGGENAGVATVDGGLYDNAGDMGAGSPAGTWQRNGTTIAYNSNHTTSKQIISGISNGNGVNINRFLGGQNDNAGLAFNGSSRDWRGPAAEIIGYTTALTATERIRVQTYLAVKYGITLATNYLSTSATTIYTTTAPYNNNIIGIGRDDAELLNQKQSHYDNDQVRLFRGTLAATNPSNGSAFTSNVSYVVMGDNDGAHCATAASIAEMPVALPSCTLFSRLEKEWKVQRTNMAQTYNMSVALAACGAPGLVNTADLRLLVDDDGNFANGGTQCYFIGDGTGINFTYANPYITIENISTTHIPNNSTRFITIASVNSATPLPVELVAFEAELNENSRFVDLTWTTETEINMDYYSVEKLVENEWITLDEMDAKGTPNSISNYATVDYQPIIGINYYRLKQIEKDGSFVYSPIRSVALDAPEDVLQVFPNPANDRVQLVQKNIKDATITLLDATGRTVNCAMIFNSDDSCILLVDPLAAGVYSIVVQGEKTHAAKIVIHH